jgi:hypothetical protein
MNIFILDNDPIAAAQSQIDKHIVKMPLETAQLLCTAARVHGASDVRYKPTHSKHPCTLWAATSQGNYEWLLEHGLGLAREYTRRYGKMQASEAVIREAAAYLSLIPAGALTPFAQAMPDEYRGADAVAAYRRYYLGAKRAFATWKAPAVTPSWWQPTVC